MLPTPFLLFSFFSVLSVTLSRPKMTFESKAASELNISFIFLPSHRHMHIYIYIPIHICVYEYIHTCIYIYISSKRKRRKEEEKKKNRSIYVHRNRPCMCVYMCVCVCMNRRPFLLFFLVFFSLSQSPWTNRQAAAVAVASLNVINLGRATFVRLLVLYRKCSCFFSRFRTSFMLFNNVHIE